MTAPDLLIDDVLKDLGYRTEPARHAARAALVRSRLTNDRKQRIAASKLDAVQRVLGECFALACTRASCRAIANASERTILEVNRPTDCSFCQGSENRRSIDGAIVALVTRGVRRVVVVGGSPGTHDELRDLVGDRLELRIVPGTERRTTRDAKADLAWADLIAIWGSTELDHKVSKLYTDGKHDKVVTCTRRGIASLATTLTETASRL